MLAIEKSVLRGGEAMPWRLGLDSLRLVDSWGGVLVSKSKSESGDEGVGE